jgi:hypothetical protein
MIKISLVTVLVVLASDLGAQTGEPFVIPKLPATIVELSRISPWPRIGSPPVEADSPSAGEAWGRERLLLAQALDTISRSWPGERPVSPSDLRIRVGEYEELLKTVTTSGGYGNLVLADCLRRLGLALLSDYLLTFPGDHSVVAEILAMDRVRLLDAPSLHNLLNDELKLQTPPGGWRLSQRRESLEIVFRSGASTYRNEIGRLLVDRPTLSKLTARRDVNGLLVRLIEDEAEEKVVIAGFAEFLKQGGHFEDLRADDVRPFLQVMEGERRRFQFSPLGINMLRGEHLDQMLRQFQSRSGKPARFDAIVER